MGISLIEERPMTMVAMRVHENGGPEVIVLEEITVPTPGAGEVLVLHKAIGVNYSDINVRRGGFYTKIHSGLAHEFPLILGNEAAGVIEMVGTGVRDFRIGDRVAYAGMHGEFFEQTGAYCAQRAVPEDRLVRVPDAISFEQAAAILLKGSTASLIINRLYRPAAGDTVLIHAAASGVGSLLCQWASHLGARVIGTVGSAAKADIARHNGCEHVILYRETDFTQAVRALVPQGLTAVLDGVGKDTFEPSLALLGHFGKAINYGNASGPVAPLDIQALARRSLSVARAGVQGHIHSAEALREVADELFALVALGALRPHISETFALKDAAEAHRRLESGSVAGTVLLIP
ncbi:quinone oxidoreductase family protein [Pseudochelatococcus sp. B33]